ncbi:uncharacterized protein EI97DRAFT_430652 [Westerdykella ornata]|uniref:Uncharacterized protein n=1 Tax=Westerdykella ornata TaxID=318751 RepID=A0A6A6JSP4_WESOR|nr:uncharacterized protein EI97DRAFT_430652 [Westerdykella ornata]KAF2279620.1 hypothetical protein EI97DRAFT_430652 [Westerdykella ornata]
MSSTNATPRMSGTATPAEGFHQKESKAERKHFWSSLKHALVEHHKSVNNAYAACYGAGVSRP